MSHNALTLPSVRHLRYNSSLVNGLPNGCSCFATTTAERGSAQGSIYSQCFDAQVKVLTVDLPPDLTANRSASSTSGNSSDGATNQETPNRGNRAD